jgi:hypothetical protein
MQKYLSIALILTGILHNVLGIATMHDTLHRMWQEGLVASVQANDASYALLWFLVAGFALMLIGTTFWQLANAGQLGCPPHPGAVPAGGDHLHRLSQTRPLPAAGYCRCACRGAVDFPEHSAGIMRNTGHVP